MGEANGWTSEAATGEAAARTPGGRGRGLPARFFEGECAEVARRLLGAILWSSVDGRPAGGMIVETEAYVGPHDPASHARASTGRTARNAAMFGRAGTLYVYLSHGVHHCANVVTGLQGFPAAALVRALSPVEGRAVMLERRKRETDLCNGPGRLCQALGITLRHDGRSLADPPVQLFSGTRFDDAQVGVSGRIGVSRAADWPLRFFVKGHPCVRAPRE